jgi:hypothetical protein
LALILWLRYPAGSGILKIFTQKIDTSKKERAMLQSKKIIVLAFCLLFIVPTLRAADALTDWENGIFMEIVQKWHELLYTLPSNMQPGKNEFQTIYQQIAYQYNISTDEVKRIDNKGLAIEPSDQDYKICDELYKQLDAMPQSSTTDDARRIHVTVANQFGISLEQLHKIEYLMDVGFWYF